MELEEVGEVLNEHFESVVIKEDMDDVKIREGCVDVLQHVNIKKEVVLGVLKNIKVDETPGSVGTYSRIVMEAKEEIAGGLTEIFVSSLAT
eukprot:g33948.t1